MRRNRPNLLFSLTAKMIPPIVGTASKPRVTTGGMRATRNSAESMRGGRLCITLVPGCGSVWFGLVRFRETEQSRWKLGDGCNNRTESWECHEARIPSRTVGMLRRLFRTKYFILNSKARNRTGPNRVVIERRDPTRTDP